MQFQPGRLLRRLVCRLMVPASIISTRLTTASLDAHNDIQTLLAHSHTFLLPDRLHLLVQRVFQLDQSPITCFPLIVDKRTAPLVPPQKSRRHIRRNKAHNPPTQPTMVFPDCQTEWYTAQRTRRDFFVFFPVDYRLFLLSYQVGSSCSLGLYASSYCRP